MCDLNLEHKMVGAGDNQVVAVLLKNDRTLPGWVTTVKNDIANTFSDIGLEIKLEETWHSSDLLAYQRKYYYKGKQVPNALKQTNKGFSGASDMDSGICSTISTAMNSGVNIAGGISDPYLGAIISYVEAYSVIFCNPTIDINRKLPLEKLAALSLVGSEFGFLPFVLLPTFLYSGHKNPLSGSLGKPVSYTHLTLPTNREV